jgi:hypothetical protein
MLPKRCQVQQLPEQNQMRQVEKLIPPHTECRFKAICTYEPTCSHKGLEHKVPFSCAVFRLHQLFEKPLK